MTDSRIISIAFSISFRESNDASRAIVCLSPNLAQFGLDLPLKNLDQLPVRLHQLSP
jgi:hypothetical protein